MKIKIIIFKKIFSFLFKKYCHLDYIFNFINKLKFYSKILKEYDEFQGADDQND
jgi:hypothetical protein